MTDWRSISSPPTLSRNGEWLAYSLMEPQEATATLFVKNLKSG